MTTKKATATKKTETTKATETKKTTNTIKKEETTMTTETKKATETKKPEAPKKTVESIKTLLTKLSFECDLIDVKPAGVGVKTSKTRVCAVYVTRQNGYRVKTNKLAIVDQIINTYAPSLETKLTSDKRDYEITGSDLDDDMLLTMITELALGVSTAKTEKAEAKKAEAEKKAAEKVQKAADKAAEKLAKAEAKKAAKKEEKKEEKKSA